MYGKKKTEYRLMSTKELEKEMTDLINKISQESNMKRKQGYLRAYGRVVDVLRERN